jgi:hypothetical protein
MQRRSARSSGWEVGEVPVQRFRSLDDARRAMWVAPDDPALFARIRQVWRFSARLLDRRIPRGLRRFSSIEAANAERDRWIAARIDALVSERDRPDR